MKKQDFYLLCIGLWIFCSCNSSENHPDLPALPKQISYIKGLATIEPEQRIIDLHVQSTGTVHAIYHQINDSLTEGALILELENALQKSNLTEQENQLKSQELLILNAQDNLQLIETNLENTAKNYRRDSTLYAQKVISGQAYDNSLAHYKTTQKQRDIAKDNLTLQKQKIQIIQEDIRQAEIQLEHTRLRAPMSGQLLSLDIKIGEYVQNSTPLGQFAPSGNHIAITEVDEQFAEQVQIGQMAYILNNAEKDTIAQGKVVLAAEYLRKKSLFSQSATEMQDRRVREVRILLEDAGSILIGSRVVSVICVK